MIELNDLLILGILSTIISVIIAGIVVWASFQIRNRDVNEAYRRIDSLEQSVRGQISGNRKAEKSERMNQAMGEAALMLKEGKPPQEIFKELVGKYPDVAMEMAKKGGISL